MKNTIIANTLKTPVAKSIGTSVDRAIHSAFKGKTSIPLQEVIGSVISMLNKKGLVTNHILTSDKMDAENAEMRHSILVENTTREVLKYVSGYGCVITRKNQKRGQWITHWIIELNIGIFRLLEKEEKVFNGPTVKRLRSAKVQTRLVDALGVNTEVMNMDAEYLEGLSKQYVKYEMDIEALKDDLTNVYSESKKMANGTIKYKEVAMTKANVKSHMMCLSRLDGKEFPVNELLEPRGRTAKQQLSLFGMNFYGKTWETQSFRLGDKTIAYDARQSGYQILGGLLGVNALAKITGVYSEIGGDIYLDVFMDVLKRVFDGQEVSRAIAKKPAQMLAYMAGMKSILLEDDKGEGSIWSLLAPEGADLGDYANILEAEFNAQPELKPIMELREQVRDGHVKNYASPKWNFPNSSDYFFTRSDTSFLDKQTKQAMIINVIGDNDVAHNMSIHIEVIRADAKYSAILAAIVHSIDAYIKKAVSIDVWNAGGKILVKHDEYVTNIEHFDVMNASYHKWLAYVAENRKEFLEIPLRECGYEIDLDSMVKENESVFGKLDTDKIKNSTHGLKYEWTV